MIKFRYLFGIPFLFAVGYMGGNILIEAIFIGIFTGYIDGKGGPGGGPMVGPRY